MDLIGLRSKEEAEASNEWVSHDGALVAGSVGAAIAAGGAGGSILGPIGGGVAVGGAVGIIAHWHGLMKVAGRPPIWVHNRCPVHIEASLCHVENNPALPLGSGFHDAVLWLRSSVLGVGCVTNAVLAGDVLPLAPPTELTTKFNLVIRIGKLFTRTVQVCLGSHVIVYAHRVVTAESQIQRLWRHALAVRALRRIQRFLRRALARRQARRFAWLCRLRNLGGIVQSQVFAFLGDVGEVERWRGAKWSGGGAGGTSLRGCWRSICQTNSERNAVVCSLAALDVYNSWTLKTPFGGRPSFHGAPAWVLV